MKVDPQLQAQTVAATLPAQGAATPPPGEDPAVTNPEASDRVEISDSANASRELRAEERVDVERVERLKAAIQAGSFAVDPERVAEAVLGEER